MAPSSDPTRQSGRTPTSAPARGSVGAPRSGRTSRSRPARSATAAQHRGVGGAKARRHPCSGRLIQGAGEERHMSGLEIQSRKNLMLFTGRAYPELAAEVGVELGVAPVPTAAYEFANGEIFV